MNSNRARGGLLLINPPVAKPCEPPGGIARLAGALRSHGVSCSVLDLSLEGLLYLLDADITPSGIHDTRAVKNRAANLAALRSMDIYSNSGRYIKAVLELERAVELAGQDYGATVGLGNMKQDGLSPVRSDDLLLASDEPERSPFYSHFSRRLDEIIGAEHPGVAGVSLMYLNQALTAFAIGGYIKKRYPMLKLVLGGGLVTSWMSRPGWRNPWPGLWNRMVSGPGEVALCKIMGIELDAGEATLPSFDRLPLHDYLSPGFVLPYSTSSGCWWGKCAFCPERAERNPYCPLPAALAAGQIRELVVKHRPALIHLLDNAVSPALMNEFIADPPGAPWYGFARVREELTDEGYCRKLKESGCVMLKLGLESGHQGVLDAMNKGISLETASRVLRTLGRVGIKTYVYLMFGTPWESEAEARQTLEFTARHAEDIGFLNLSIFNMPLGLPESSQYETGAFYEGDLSLYTEFKHPKGWNRREARQFIESEFKRHPAIAPIVRRTPPVFTSNHAPFMPVK